MKSECCVCGCRSNRYVVPYHTFPKKPEQFALWKAAVYSPKIEGLTEKEIRNRMVCYLHFKDDDYIVGARNRKLKPDTIPSVALSSPIDESTPKVEVLQNVQPSCSYDFEGGNTGKAYPAIRIPTVKVSQNVQPSYCHQMQDGNTSKEAYTAVPTVATEVSGTSDIQQSTTPGPNRKQRLCSLGGTTNTRDLTPRKKKLYKTARLLCRWQAYAEKKLRTVKQRLRVAEKFYNSKSLQSLLSNLTATQQAFLELQLRTSKYAPRGSQYSMEEKILCLSIYNQSRRAYKFLELMFNLPNGKILRGLLRGMVLQPGINANMMEHLREKARSMARLDKICCLMWDAVSIQPHIDFSPTLQRIVGFEDHGKLRRPKFTDVAVVFMLRGIKTGWKLPLAFYFSDSQTTSTDLASCIKEVTEGVVNSGLRIAAYVCDQGSLNVKAMNDLVSETATEASSINKLSGNIIHLHGQTIVAVYDAPHLIKGVRNKLLTKDLEVTTPAGDGKEYLSWEIIDRAYEMDNVEPPFRIMIKITQEHVKRHKIRKMRVKHAVQVLSQTMGRYINHLSQVRGYVNSIRGPLSMPAVEGKAASKYIRFFDDLFDSCNGHTVTPEKKYRGAVTGSSPHMRFWTNAIAQLERMQFVDPINKERKDRSTVLKNWIATLAGFRSLNTILQGEGFKHWFPRNINQDALEHFFGCMRTLGYRDTNKPTAIEFINHFKTLIINNITTRRSVGGNCESKGTGTVLFNLSSLVN